MRHVFFHQVLDPDLGCASYLIGCGAAAAVVDPGLDPDSYLRRAAVEGASIVEILETHTHADHVSGRRELAAATGARVRLPWRDGDGGLPAGTVVTVGEVRIEALATPGHRPEHVALVVSDTARAARAWMVLTGDSLLVGDVARPDLAVDAERGAEELWATIGRLRDLGDDVELWPGHVGGSLCGGAGLSRKPSSTIGYERRANPLAGELAQREFVERLLAELPPRPPTVARVVTRNAGDLPPPAAAPALDAAGLGEQLGQPQVVVIDGRAAAAFDVAHLSGSLNLPLSGNGLGTRAAWVLDPEQPIVVLAGDEHAGAELAHRLRAVALDGVVGFATFDAATLAGVTTASAATVAVGELARRLGDVTVVDVRGADEWAAGHVEDSVHLPLERLRDADDLLPDGPLAVGCALGNRAAFAASWLRRRGRHALRVADGGIPDLAHHGLRLVTG